MEGYGHSKVFNKCEDVLDTLFEVQMLPSHSSEPWRVGEDDGVGHFLLKLHLVRDMLTARNWKLLHCFTDREVALKG